MKLRGYIYTILSVILFSFMTLLVKLITKTGNIPAVEVVFFRFIIGFLAISITKKSRNLKINPINKKALWARAICNTLAVVFFFVTIQLSTITKANIYNLTYPVFVALIAPIFLPERLNFKKFLAVLLALFGTYLVVGAKIENLNIGDLVGILSGLTAGFAIVSLKKARLTDESFTILYYLMSIGTVITFISFMWFFKIPSLYEFMLLISVGLVSFAGQYTITYGMKYITAVESSILSSSRIFIAALLSVLILGEILTLNVLLGGVIIFISIVLINTLSSQKKVIKNDI